MSEVVYCDPSQSRLGWRPSEDWPGWGCLVSILVAGAPKCPGQLDLFICRQDFYPWQELLEAGELGQDGHGIHEDCGFRVSWGVDRPTNHITIVRNAIGWLQVRCVFSHYVPGVGNFVSNWFNPSQYAAEHFEQAISYLLERPPA